MAATLPYNALHAFVVAAKHGSFSKAADELHVTPAAISQQIRQLEDLLGVQLFHRMNRGLTLTAAGNAGLATMDTGFKHLHNAVSMMKSEPQKTQLSIWTSPSFANKWLMPRMHRFIEQYPSIELHISGSASLIDSASAAPSLSAEILKAHNIDLAIRFGSGNYPGCVVEHLVDVDAVTLCSPSLLEKKDRPPLNSPKDLVNYTLLHDDSPYEGRPKWSSWFESAGLTDIQCDHNLYFNSALLALTAAIEGQGIVLTIEQLAQNDIDKGLLVRLFELPMEVEHAYRLVSLDAPQPNPHVQVFKNWLLEEVASSGAP
jgi:LysR family glycine cleavage system transcriptional activator